MVEKTILKCSNCKTYTLHFMYIDNEYVPLWVCAECKKLVRAEKPRGVSK